MTLKVFLALYCVWENADLTFSLVPQHVPMAHVFFQAALCRLWLCGWFCHQVYMALNRLVVSPAVSWIPCLPTAPCKSGQLIPQEQPLTLAEWKPSHWINEWYFELHFECFLGSFRRIKPLFSVSYPYSPKCPPALWGQFQLNSKNTLPGRSRDQKFRVMVSPGWCPLLGFQVAACSPEHHSLYTGALPVSLPYRSGI